MDAWETLTLNSSLESGDAWELLNSQEGGTGETVIVDGVVSAQIIDSLSANIVVESYSAEITDVASASISDEVLSAVLIDTLDAQES